MKDIACGYDPFDQIKRFWRGSPVRHQGTLGVNRKSLDASPGFFWEVILPSGTFAEPALLRTALGFRCGLVAIVLETAAFGASLVVSIVRWILLFCAVCLTALRGRARQRSRSSSISVLPVRSANVPPRARRLGRPPQMLMHGYATGQQPIALR